MQLDLEEQRITFVLGPHRSGTSAVAGLLWLLGLEFGPRDQMLRPVEHDNPKGFYEHRMSLEVNEYTLRRLGGSWREPPALNPGWEMAPELDDLLAQAKDLIERDFAGAPSWAVKDPRASLTLPLWRRLVRPTAYVVCYRHPLAVASSLERRNQIPLAQGLALWGHYMAHALVNTAEEKRLLVSYDGLFTERDQVVTQLAAFVGSPGAMREREFQVAVDVWLEGQLRHQRPSFSDLVSHHAISAEVRELALLLEVAVQASPSQLGQEGERRRVEIENALNLAASRLAGGGVRRGQPTAIGS